MDVSQSLNSYFTKSLAKKVEFVLIAISLILADVIADWCISPMTKRFMILGPFLKEYLPRIFGKPIQSLGPREMRLTQAAGVVLIFAAYLGSSYLSMFLIFPSNFGNYFAINHLITQILSPVFDYFNFNGTDELNLGLFQEGTANLICFVTTTWLLRNWIGICIFLYRLVFNVMSVTIIAGAIGTVTVWMYFIGGGWKDRGKSYVGNKSSLAFWFLAGKLIMSLDKVLSFLRIAVDIFNWCDSWIIEKRKSRMPPKESYRYGALNGLREIRLLKLSRRKLFSALQCELVHVSLDDHPNYEAVSYTWGGEQPTIDTIINCKTLRLTPALVDILSYRQTFLGSSYFWIDAACINQADINERGQQVGLMKDIYKKASRVVIWLGPLAKAEDANLARELLHYLYGQKHMLSATPEDIYKLAIQRTTPGWEPLGQMFAHRWFSRVWVVQEVAVATNVHIMYGRTCTSWEIFAAASEVLTDPHIFGPAQTTDSKKLKSGENVPYPLEEVMEKVSHVANLALMVNVRERLFTKRSITLGDALFFGMNFQSTDPRDKVYGLMGIVTDGLPLPDDLTPDYNIPVAELYIKTMRYLVAQPSIPYLVHPLYIAGIGLPRSPEMEEADLPSWVVDWNATNNQGRFTVGSSGRDSQIGATGWTADLFGEDPSVLQLQAVEIDGIETVSLMIRDLPDGGVSVSLSDWTAPTYGKSWRDWKDDAWKLTQEASHEVYPTDDILREAFWRTLTGPTAGLDASACAANWAFFEKLSDNMNAGKEIDDSEALAMGARLSPMIYRMGGQCAKKRFCVTRGGRLGLLPLQTMKGDRIYRIQGLQLPIILREKTVGDGGAAKHSLVGACFVDGLTDGLGPMRSDFQTYYLQ